MLGAAMWDDRQAMARVAARDTAGLEVLYDRYSTMVYSLALRIVRNTSDAEDVTQEAFAQVWSQAARFDPERGAVPAWLAVIARSRALDRLRRAESRGGPASGDEALAAIPDPSPSVEMMAASAEQVAAARDALAALPADQRTALELAYYEGLTQAEIAARTSTPLGTVKTRVRTGLQRIRDAMGLRHTPTGGEG
jgi:RNA polymerase sigma-70 factor (ECF subfamily)